jgi:hypothetical protein
MEKKCKSVLPVSFIILLGLSPTMIKAQSEKDFVQKYLNELPDIKVDTRLLRYKMTAFYINRDLVGNFMDKTLVTGNYTCGLPGDSVKWNNAFISNSRNIDDPFPEGKRLDYIEDFKYTPSPEMLKEEAFINFPSTPENIFARNLIWDMYSFEIFAWYYYDSLLLNVPFIIPDITGEFEMADIGNYSHKKIVLCWEGITECNGELCSLISFNATDNLIALDMPMIKTKGTEQYWGTILLSLKTKNIEKAVMYSGTMQELTISGMQDKMLVKTIRELNVEKIQ